MSDFVATTSSSLRVRFVKSRTSLESFARPLVFKSIFSMLESAFDESVVIFSDSSLTEAVIESLAGIVFFDMR